MCQSPENSRRLGAPTLRRRLAAHPGKGMGRPAPPTVHLAWPRRVVLRHPGQGEPRRTAPPRSLMIRMARPPCPRTTAGCEYQPGSPRGNTHS